MGKMAFWGGVAGAAEGAQKAIDVRVQNEQSDLDNQREQAILRMKQEFEQQQQGREFGQQEKIKGMDISSATTLQTGKQEFEASQQAAELEAKAKEGAADRASREKVASIDAESRVKASNKSGAYKSVLVKTTSIDPNGMIQEKQLPLTYDPSTGSYYEDRAGKLVPYDLRNNLTAPEQALYDNPRLINQYLSSKMGQRTGVPKWFETMYGTPNAASE
jgi:hypothetical protein